MASLCRATRMSLLRTPRVTLWMMDRSAHRRLVLLPPADIAASRTRLRLPTSVAPDAPRRMTSPTNWRGGDGMVPHAAATVHAAGTVAPRTAAIRASATGQVGEVKPARRVEPDGVAVRRLVALAPLVGASAARQFLAPATSTSRRSATGRATTMLLAPMVALRPAVLRMSMSSRTTWRSVGGEGPIRPRACKGYINGTTTCFDPTTRIRVDVIALLPWRRRPVGPRQSPPGGRHAAHGRVQGAAQHPEPAHA